MDAALVRGIGEVGLAEVGHFRSDVVSGRPRAVSASGLVSDSLAAVESGVAHVYENCGGKMRDILSVQICFFFVSDFDCQLSRDQNSMVQNLRRRLLIQNLRMG